MDCTPDDVFEVLVDGWLFPSWVVGASRMRDVDPEWPQVGSHIHHSFGVWPALLDDESTVLDFDPPRLLRIQPKGRPFGVAEVTVEVRERDGGCVVRISERAVSGPASLIPPAVLDVPLHIRNVETLRRLALLAEGRRDNRRVLESRGAL